MWKATDDAIEAAALRYYDLGTLRISRASGLWADVTLTDGRLRDKGLRGYTRILECD